MWRWRELLPLAGDVPVADLGEGGTPLLPARALGSELGLPHLWIKDESGNPTGSFKARGLSMAVNVAAALGEVEFAVPSAGNAASALAAFAAARGVRAHVFMPRDTPRVVLAECSALGADVQLVDGLITDAARALRERAQGRWLDVSTLREPYRVEGKKTLGFEIAEALGWRLPDVIVYPTGGGTGLLGMWKAFEELEAMGWITPGQRPRMISVQAAGCAPLVRAFEQGREEAEPWEPAVTLAAGLRVPSAVADFWILDVVRQSGGRAVAVTEEALLRDTLHFARTEGIVACPEGGAALAALRDLVAQGRVSADETVILFNTGSGLKYLEALDAALAQEGGLLPASAR
jgi:threonine synthase